MALIQQPCLHIACITCLCAQVVSSTLAGAALGSLTGGALSDALGRRASFLLAAVPMAAGPLLSAYAGGLQAMVAGRFLAGLAIGVSSALVPTYISEVRCRCCGAYACACACAFASMAPAAATTKWYFTGCTRPGPHRR